MAKTYSKSEMTPELLHLNLQYFFDAPAREYQSTLDEIVLSTDRDIDRWLKIVDHWHDFLMNPPVESSSLRDIAENIVKTATEDNIETVLDIFDGLAAFMSSSMASDDEKITKIISTVSKLNDAIYDGIATEEAEKARKLLEEKRAEEERLEAEFLKSKTSEQTAIDDLQSQIRELEKTIEKMGRSGDKAIIREAQERINETKEIAIRIADRMENEIRTARETVEIEKQEELIRRADEKIIFEAEWETYWHKYTIPGGDGPTADMFHKFLIDEKGLTPDQVDEIAVSAAFYGNEMGNFLDFDEELQRVKDKKSK